MTVKVEPDSTKMLMQKQMHQLITSLVTSLLVTAISTSAPLTTCTAVTTAEAATSETVYGPGNTPIWPLLGCGLQELLIQAIMELQELQLVLLLLLTSCRLASRSGFLRNCHKMSLHVFRPTYSRFLTTYNVIGPQTHSYFTQFSSTIDM